MRPLTRFIVLTSLLLPAATSLAECKYRKKISHVFPASATRQVELRALAGDLEIKGKGDNIVFEGVACTDNEQFLEQITLRIDDDADKLGLTVIIPQETRGINIDYAYVDIELSLPRSVQISVTDSSGDIQVENAAITRIEDSSGDIRVIHGLTSLVIEDSSGDVDIRGLEANLEVVDSSGDIDVRDVHGDVHIPRDSAGDIDIDHVEGSVTIDGDSSGDIQIDRVTQEVVIERDGSGDIEIANVGGSVAIGSDGSGIVKVSAVTGNFNLDRKGDGDIRVRDVTGKVSIPR